MALLVEAGIKVLVAFVLLLSTTVVLVWMERKVVAGMQTRIGPDRAGPWGMLQTVADGIKLMMKESLTPRRVQFGLYIAAPVMALVPALLIFLVIPIGAPFQFGDRTIILAVTDLNIGLLYVLAISSIAVYSVVLAGWASGSKYPLLGAVRASAQMISYEAAMGLSLVPVLMFAGSASLTGIVAAQGGDLFGFLGTWNIVLFPSFVIFFISGIAETNRPPFDLVEAESEIVGGYHTEYSGFRFALFFLAEFINMFNMSALTVTLFFGGWMGPTFGLPENIHWVIYILWFFVKTFTFVFIFIWLRAALPRLRYDQLMSFGWKRLIPAALMWLTVFTVALGYRTFGLPWS
ncbi:MAG TPA: NADH-quinone oxidoreductase subunit NuoH [Actinobacteria bacterium]|nr:NADH-quinone oxidoreductase subunit H [bacterium BMS3Bbin02]HDL41994.1 NADH-quinone oxidoreductase subunit NuoH [Actinomycetota bacterium]